MNLSGGYAAGSGADMLYKIVEQAAQREQERQRNALAQEELRQRAQDRAAEQDYRNRTLSRMEAEDKIKAADREAAAKALDESRQRDDVRGEAEQTLPGSVLSAEQGARFKKYAPTTVEPYGLDPKGAANPQDDISSGVQRLAPTGQLRFRGTAAQQEKQATLDAQNRPEPVFVIDDKGVMRQVGTAPKGSHISNEPRPPTVPQPPRDRYTITDIPDPANPAKTIKVRIDNDTMAVQPITLGGNTIGGKMNATTSNRVTSAQTVLDVGNQITTKLSDPAYIAVIGPAMGRYGKVEDWIGNPPPELAELAGMIESYSLANMGVHGMRSVQGANDIKKILDVHHTPESLSAAIRGVSGFSNDFVKNATGAAPKSGGGSGAAGPPIGTRRSVGGVTAEWDGKGWKPVK